MYEYIRHRGPTGRKKLVRNIAFRRFYEIERSKPGTTRVRPDLHAGDSKGHMMRTSFAGVAVLASHQRGWL